MKKYYNRYRKRIGHIEVDLVDCQLLKHGFTNEVLLNYRKLMKNKHSDPDLYLGIAFWYRIRRIGTDLECLEKYFHQRAIKSCRDMHARTELMQYIQYLSQ